MTYRSDNAVLIETIKTQSGHKLGLITLNAPNAMNAIDVAMVHQLEACFDAWSKDNKIVAVVMRGAGDRAFSAGGDIRKLYDSMNAQGDEYLQYAEEFFLTSIVKTIVCICLKSPLLLGVMALLWAAD